MTIPQFLSQTNFSGPLPSQRSERSGFTTLFAVAIVNRDFRNLLLHDPKAALENGYLGERFYLSDDEQNLLISIQAKSLTDLAKQFIVSTEMAL
jgi:hypothetical protein